MPATIAAARAGATTGEWAQALRDAFGSYRAPTGVGEAAAPAPGEEVAALRDEVARVAEQLGRGLKILVGKPGLDGHSNGAEQIAVRARDAGMEVVYEGIRLTPAQIARSAVDEGVHVIGLSILSGSHRSLIPDVLDALREAGGARHPGRRRRDHPRGRRRRPARRGRRRRLHAEGLRADADPARRRRHRRGAQRHRRRGVSERRRTLGAPAARARPRRGARRAQPAREPRARAARGDRRAARRGRSGPARRRGARARGRRHRPARRRQVDAPGRARPRLARPRADASACSRSTRRRGARAARCSATAPGSTPIPPIAACSSGRWPRASGSAGSRPRRARRRRR